MKKKLVTKEQAILIFKEEHPEFKIVTAHLKRVNWYEEVRNKRAEKLEKEMKEIKDLIEKGVTLRAIAKKLNMSYEGIRQRLIRYTENT